MPDNEINIKINLNTTESGTSLQRIRQELNSLIAETERASRQQLTPVVGGGMFQRVQTDLKELINNLERVQRQQGWAGLRGIEKDTADIRAQIAALQELDVETQRVRNVNLERSLGPEPTREIITTRRLSGIAAPLSIAAAQDDGERERRQQALIQQTTLVHDREQKKRTDTANREADQRANAAQREADKQEQEARRAAAASSKARMADYNSWLDQQQKLDKATTTQVREAERILNRGVFTAQPNEFPVTPTTLGRLNDATQWRNFFQRRETEETIHAANQRGGFSGWTAGINRIGSLEGQAAVINTIQALASGMNPMHVAMMEIPQVAGAAVQGGLLSFKQILTFIGSAAGTTAIALGGVAAVLGQIISTGAQARTAMLTTQGSLTARGFGGEGVISQENLIKERAQLRSQFRNVIGSSDINEIFGQLNVAAPEAQQFRGRLATTAVAIAGTENIAVSDAAKELAKAAEGGAEGLIKFSEKLNIGDAISRERLSTMATANPVQAFDQALRLIEQRMEPGRAATATEGPWLIPALPKIISSVQTDVEQRTIYNSLRYLFTGFAPIDQTKATVREPQAMQVGLGLAVAGTPEMKERVDLQEKYNKLLQTQRELLQSIENLPQGGPEIDTQMERLSRVNESIRNVERADRPKGVAETKQDAADMARLQRNLELAQNAANNDISQASRVVSARAALNAEITRQHASAVELQKGKARELSAAEIQAAQETEQARRGLAQRSIDIMLQLSNLERARIGPANISAQREIVQRNVATVTADRDVDESLKISQQTEEVNVLRNERLEVENVNIAQIRQGELVLQAKEDLAGIVTLRRQEAAIIEGSKDRSPADVIQARSNVIQSQIQASTQARRLELESVNSIGQAEERRFQTVSALLNLQVARGTANTWQTLPLEQQITSQGTDTQAARLQALLNTGNLERSERIRVNEQLAALYEADAQKQIELQTRVTESIKAENTRRVENFKNFFSSVETASSDLLIAGLLKSQTKEQAVKSFATSVVTSFVKETENMASKFAGKGLAKLLDVKLGEGEDSSISNVLAKKAGSVLGITLDEPKVNQAAIADRMKQAGDAQKQAGDLMLQAAREMSAKAQEAPYKGGKGTELSTDVVRETEKRASTTVGTNYTTGSATASDPRGMEPVIRAAAAKYGHDPDIAVKVAKSEGLGTFSGDSGKSGGAFQLYTGGGLGNEFQKETGLDPLDPKNEVATIDYAMRNLDRTGWSPYHGAKRVGVSDRQGISVNAPQAQPTTPLDQPAQVSPLQLSQPMMKSDYFLPTQPLDQPTVPAAIPSASTTAYNPVAIGDSIAAHLIRKTGGQVSGKEDSTAVRNYRTGDTAVSGFTPREIAENVVPRIPPETVRGKDVVLSSGASNGPGQVDSYVPQQIQQLKDMQAKSVTLLGVGTRSDLAGTNDKLAEIAADAKINFSGPLRSVAADQIHSSDNTDLLRQIKEVQVSSDRGSTATSVAARSDTQEPVQAPQYYAPSILSNPAAPTSTYFMNNAPETNWKRSENTDLASNTPSPLKVEQTVHTQPVVERNGLVQNPTISADSIIQNPTITAETLENNRHDQAVKVDPASVSQGVQQGQQNVVSTFRSSIQEGTIQGQAATVSATNRDVQQTETNARDVESNSNKTETNTQSIDKLTNQLQTQATQTIQTNQQTTVPGVNAAATSNYTTNQDSALTQTYNDNYQRGLEAGLQGKTSTTTTNGDTVSIGGAASPTVEAGTTGTGLSSFSGLKSGFSTLSQGLGLASSAALLFGNRLSTTGRMVLGGASLIANGFTFLSSVTTLLQGANTVNTVATTANTVATTANSTAQTTSAAGSGAGSLLKAIPLIGGLFEGGGVVSAERGIVIPSMISAAGGDIISSITSAAAGTVVRPIISAEVGTVLHPIPSAAGGMFVKENSLSSSIRSGIQSMARGGQAGAFASGRMVSGPRVNDGKGGQLIIAHDGEMVVPRAETTMILNSINNPVVHSAEAGMILNSRGGAAISMSPPRASNLRSNIDNSIREAITNVASTSNVSSTNNNTTLNYTAHTTGYSPYRTRSDIEGMLRQHSSTLMRWAESNFRNGSWPQRSF